MIGLTYVRGALVAALILIGAAAATAAGQAEEDVVHVYSNRHYDTDRALYEAFEEETGIDVRVVEAGSDELIQRLAAEGEQSQADLIITADVGRLHRAKEMDLLQPVESAVLTDRLPARLRDPENQWFALTKRARIVAYHRERADRSILSTYAALAGPGFADNIAVRSSGNVYNQSLLASIVAHNGEDAARDWAVGVVANMAREPQGGDRDQLRAIAAGEADYAIVNTYYVGQMLTSSDPQDRAVAEQIGVFFPNQDGRGAHVNISGAGVTRVADNVDGAIRLIEFMLSDDSQRQVAQANYEYPAVDGIAAAPEIAAWGDLKEDALPLTRIGELNDTAVRIFDEVGWQ